MGLEFANPAGWWALLGIPVILAIHFLHQPSRTVPTSTLFLIEMLAPASRAGRRWERLRASRTLWLQLLAVLLAAWTLLEPRWVRADSTQTVAIVLDSSAAMSAFRADAVTAAEQLMADNESRAQRTEWIVASSDPRAPAFYRGPDRRAARAALATWQPGLATHDPRPALQLAQALAGAGGSTWFVTSSRTRAPAGQATVGVGHPLPNVGFAGASLRREDGRLRWRAIVRNHGEEAQTRRWWLEAGGGRTPERTLALAAGGLVELSGELPDGAERCVVALEPDEFPNDDRLPLVRPVAKPLRVRVDVEGATGDYFRKVIGALDGVDFTAPVEPQLVVARRAADTALPARSAIVIPPPTRETGGARLLQAPVLPEKEGMVSDLNWQGLLDPGPGDFMAGKGDEVLLWQSDRPLAWLTGKADATRSLIFNFDWDASNASRLAAPVLLIHRFVTRLRDAQRGTQAVNLDGGAPVPLAVSERAGGLVVEFQALDGAAGAARTIDAAEAAVLRAPLPAGFFAVRRGSETVVSGATWFADSRQADFRSAETFVIPLADAGRESFLRNTRPDPLRAGWIAAIGLCLLGCWWAGRGSAPPAAATVRRSA